ncbi:MAG: hypothetical protein ACYCVB_11420 [Bacilli bacterium]
MATDPIDSAAHGTALLAGFLLNDFQHFFVKLDGPLNFSHALFTLTKIPHKAKWG